MLTLNLTDWSGLHDVCIAVHVGLCVAIWAKLRTVAHWSCHVMERAPSVHGHENWRRDI